MAQIHALEPIIGGFPPNIKNEKEADKVKKRYAEIKSELDTLLHAHADDQDLLFMRGLLQSMGHNFDYPGAFQGSTDDFTTLLKINPAQVQAQVELANLWVNSDKNLAPEAEKLFRGAQCYTGSEPLEDAQRGIFFALYYQGNVEEALRQSEYLMQTWPENAQYKDFNKMTLSVLARSNMKADTKTSAPIKLAMATCNK